MSNGATTANTRTPDIARAATAIAPSAKARLAKSGWSSAAPSCCPPSIFTWSSRSPSPSPPSPSTTRRLVYDILFRATAETLLTIARDPKRLGVELGFFAVLHSWGQNLHFHPHLHCVVPGGGLSADQDQWIHGRRRYLLPVKVLSRLFRRLFLEQLANRLYLACSAIARRETEETFFNNTSCSGDYQWDLISQRTGPVIPCYFAHHPNK